MKKKMLLPVLVLVVVTVILAAVHLGNSPEAAPGTVLIQVDGREETYSLTQQRLTEVTGTIVNGKGDQIPVQAKGLPLSQILSGVGAETYETVTLVARDEYRAQVTAEEIRETGKVYLVLEEADTLRLVVFGDGNSKRNVSDVIQIIVE